MHNPMHNPDNLVRLRSPILFLLLHLGSLPQLLVTLGDSEVKALMLRKSLFLRLSTPHPLQISQSYLMA